jgi:hypothetical protein
VATARRYHQSRYRQGNATLIDSNMNGIAQSGRVVALSPRRASMSVIGAGGGTDRAQVDSNQGADDSAMLPVGTSLRRKIVLKEGWR